MSDDKADYFNENLDGWCAAMGVRFVRATGDEVVAEVTVEPRHLQAYGIVHGGVHAGLIETLASVGAALHVMPEGRTAVGLENTTSFLRAVREGTLTATARPLTRGRKTHVWQVDVAQGDRLVATGRVRMIVLSPEDRA